MAKYFIFPGILPGQFTADTLDEAQNKARGLALSGHESATVFEPVWSAVRSEALTENYLGNAVDTAAEVAAQISLENAHAALNAKAATLSLVGGMTEAPTEAADAAMATEAPTGATPAPDIDDGDSAREVAAQADGFATQATEAQPDPSRTPFNPGV